MADGAIGKPAAWQQRQQGTTHTGASSSPVGHSPVSPTDRTEQARIADLDREDAGSRPAPHRRSILAVAAPAAFGAVGLLAGCERAGAAADGGDGGPVRYPAHRSPSPAHRSPSPAPSPSPTRTRKRPPELPRGGRTLFPAHRLFGYCGLPGAGALGRLGTGDPEQRADEIEQRAHDYADGRAPLPLFELLATVANAGPGPGGAYRTRTPSDTIGRFHDLARKHRAILLLNIQPGRASVLDEVRALHRWLVHPDVGLVLDPEWEMGPAEVPGRTYGHTDGSELSAVARYLSDIVKDGDLPEKPLVFHQVTTSVVRDRNALRRYPGVVPIMSVDGIGSPRLKRATWNELVRNLPDGVHAGFKLFFDEDTRGGTRLMTSKDVLALRPQPEYVMYE